MANKKIQKSKKITFCLEAPEAKKVSLAGDFNGWCDNSTLLKKGKDSFWKRDIVLKSGRHEYKFVVDGNWVSDPSNNNRSLSPLGTENSVLEV